MNNKKEIIYDLTSFESALKSLQILTNINEKRKIRAFISENKENPCVYKKFCKQLNVNFDNLDISNVVLKVIHVTTNNNNCEELKSLGLLNLKDTIKLDTQLSRYLKQYGVVIDIEKEIITYAGRSYSKSDLTKYNKFSNKYDKIKDTFRKLYDDYQVNGFICDDNPVDYGGGVRYRPEFLYNLSSLLENKSIEQDWIYKSNNKCYTIIFKASVYDFIWFNYTEEFETQEDYNDNKDFYIKKWLINSALWVLNDGLFYGSLPEIFAYLNFNYKVSPKDIIKYIEN
ncbi:hypothetical protein FDC35_03945 [Clostridium botulinum]|nr:hypothetical protein [Clostridium botulinum]NFM10379.1 hypothetical protein [Clostridium botulinum]NFO73254.1 hypothetical protein [Clostridium botulinum]NFP00064.1 hypothetical protein [Clostridium botulinum]